MYHSEGIVDRVAYQVSELQLQHVGAESTGLFSADLFASSGGHSGNQCAALFFF